MNGGERTGRLIAGVILLVMGVACGLFVVGGTIILLEADRYTPGATDPTFFIFVLIGLAGAVGLLWAGVRVLAAASGKAEPPRAASNSPGEGLDPAQQAASLASGSPLVGCISVVAGLFFMATGGACAFFGATAQMGWSILVGLVMAVGGFVVMRYGR